METDKQLERREGLKIKQNHSLLITYLKNGFKDAVDHHIFQYSVLTNIVCYL